jgi:hypothetical protein
VPEVFDWFFEEQPEPARRRAQMIIEVRKSG